jgi:cob(II)yrinic acid a,c-diamide reductase
VQRDIVARARQQYIPVNRNQRDAAVLKKADVEPQTYRDAMARFAGAVHVVTTDGPAGKRGATVIAACSVSDAPPTILVCLNRENPKNDAFVENRRFALNTLTPAQQALAIGFSGVTGLPVEERFALGRWTTIATGAPVLVGAMAVFDCELYEAKDMATHRILFGKVTGLRIGDSVEPLLYFDRAYRVL